MIPDSDTDDVVVPDDLAAALRRAADAVPAADLHPSEPKLRYAVRRRRRRTAAACLTSAAVLVTAVLAVKAVDRPAGSSDVAVAERSPTAARGEGHAVDGPEEPLLLSEAHAELEPDGSTRRLPLARPDDIPMGHAVRLPDGRLVTLASRDLQPGVERDDGALAEGVAFVLAVFDADGGLLQERDIRVAGEQVAIAGVHDGQVVLVRNIIDGNCCGALRGLLVTTIDPDTFEETSVTEVDNLPGDASVAGDRLVLVDDGTTGVDADAGRVPACRITLVDLASGHAADVTTLPCIGLQGVAISPDGSRVAVVIQRRAGITVSGSAIESGQDILDQAVVFVSLDDGEVLGSERFDITPACPMVGDRDCAPQGPVEYRGLAWADDDHVELVVQDPDPEADPRSIEVGVLVPERLRTLLVEVGGDPGD